MREDLDIRLSAGRIRDGRFGSTDCAGLNGCFQIMGPCGTSLRIIASTANADRRITKGWEHVSVSCQKRCPNWTEMCFVKALFWKDDEVVVQFHPKKEDYISNHAYCLHMFRHELINFPMPPSVLVGDKTLGELKHA